MVLVKGVERKGKLASPTTRMNVSKLTIWKTTNP